MTVDSRTGAPVREPARISKLPLGLLGFLGLKNGGVYPQFLADQLITNLDLLDLYAAAHRADRTFTTAVNAVGHTVLLTCGEGQLWYIPQASLHALTIAAEAINFSISGTTSFGGAVIQYSDAAGVGASTRCVKTMPRGIWLSNGDTIGFSVNSITTAANITVNTFVRRLIFEA